MSVDTHKYGYAAKGTSVVLYRDEELRSHQFFTSTDWPGGLYFSPTLAGSRPGALSASCWAALLSMGEEGYLRATKSILETADKIKAGIKEIPEIKILGNPVWILAFASDTINIYEVLDQHLGPLGVPAFQGALIGHIAGQVSIPVGIPAEINASAGTIRLLEPVVA